MQMASPLVRIADQLMPYREDVEVGLLIGRANCARATPPGREDDPYAKKTALGWGVIGIISLNKNAQWAKMLELDFSETSKEEQPLSLLDRYWIECLGVKHRTPR